MKGAGEGGTIGAPAAIASAVEDALRQSNRPHSRVTDHAGEALRSDRAGAARVCKHRIRYITSWLLGTDQPLPQLSASVSAS